MARSLKKGPYVHHSLEKKVMKNVEENKKSVIKTWSRASLITPDLLVRRSVFIMAKHLFLFM